MKFRTKLINLYRILTLPYRAIQMSRFKKQGQVPIGILFYHRVDDEHPNPWTICMEEFEKQITWMQENFDLVSLEECQKRIASGFNDRPTLSITFDDGYADNCVEALPMLVEHGIPVTYFVTTEHTLQQKPFQHDLDLGQNVEPNNLETLRALANAGIEIGAHTRTHPDLGRTLDPDVLYDEIIAATVELENAIDQKIKYFAFPFGKLENLNRSVFKLCREHGMAAACTATNCLNFPGDDPFILNRIHGDSNFDRLRNWLTLDPRIVRKNREIRMEDLPVQLSKTTKLTPQNAIAEVAK